MSLVEKCEAYEVFLIHQ